MMYTDMRKLFTVCASLGIFFSLPSYAYAANLVQCPPGQFNALCSLTADNFSNLLGNIINFAFIIAVLIALLFLIWGGIKWITSGGDKANVETARNHIIAAVIGLILVFLSYFILNIVVYVFTKQSLFNLTIPTLTP